MQNEISKYTCEMTIEDYFYAQGLSITAQSIEETIEEMREIDAEYNRFIQSLEIFFNHQINSPEDLNELNGDTVELSDETERVFFPFKKVDGQLKFAETESWRLVIMSAIASKKIRTEIEDYNEPLTTTQLQFPSI